MEALTDDYGLPPVVNRGAGYPWGRDVSPPQVPGEGWSETTGCLLW